MKQVLFFLCIVLSTSLFAQHDYYTKKGFVAEGYDVVSYFSQKAEKGNKKFSTTYEGAKFQFVNKENLEKFKKTPKKYVPQYGGYCAYAIGKSGEKVSINPKSFEIRDGKLYLFYNAWGTNTKELWTKEGAKALQESADKNWKKLSKEN